LALSKGAFEDALMDKTDRILGGVTLETERESWPLCTIKAKALTAPRMALIAEAAHVMSPITAQGLNLSLRDVAALAESIVDAARLGVDIGSQSVLSAYEKRRGLDIDTRVFGVDHMNRMVSSEAKVMKDLRRLGLKTLEAVPAIKTLSMHVGLAPQMDMGRLVKGEAL
jgi:2-octaprenyl-6-methoxyphenol hydroxylase